MCFLFLVCFQAVFQIAQCLQMLMLVFAEPAFRDFMDWNGVKVMKLLPSMPDGGDQIGRFQDREMLGNGLPGHVEVPAQFAESLPVFFAQIVQQFSTAGIRQRFEHLVHAQEDMQPKGCMSSGFFTTKSPRLQGEGRKMTKLE